MRDSSGSLRSIFIASVAAAAIAGCRNYNWRGTGYSEQAQSWTKNLRPPADELRFSGLDAKARDIERSLGVR